MSRCGLLRFRVQRTGCYQVARLLISLVIALLASSIHAQDDETFPPDTRLFGRWERVTPDPKNLFPKIVEFGEVGETRVIKPGQEPELGQYTRIKANALEINWSHIDTGPFEAVYSIDKDELRLSARFIYKRIEIPKEVVPVDAEIIQGPQREKLNAAVAGVWKNTYSIGPRTLALLRDGRAIVNPDCLFPRRARYQFRVTDPSRGLVKPDTRLEIYVEGMDDEEYFDASVNPAASKSGRNELLLGFFMDGLGTVYPDPKAMRKFQPLGTAADADKAYAAYEQLCKFRPVAQPLAKVYRSNSYLILGEWKKGPIYDTTASGPYSNQTGHNYSGVPDVMAFLPDGRYIAAFKLDGRGAIMGTYAVVDNQNLELASSQLPGGKITYPIRLLSTVETLPRRVDVDYDNQRDSSHWQLTRKILGEGYRSERVNGELSLPESIVFFNLELSYYLHGDKNPVLHATLRKPDGLLSFPENLKVLVEPGTVLSTEDFLPNAGLKDASGWNTAGHQHVIISAMQRLDSQNWPQGKVNELDFASSVGQSAGDLREITCLLTTYHFQPSISLNEIATLLKTHSRPMNWPGFNRHVPDAIALVKGRPDPIKRNPAVQRGIWMLSALWDEVNVDYFRSCFTAQPMADPNWKEARRLIQPVLERRPIPPGVRDTDPVGVWLADTSLTMDTLQDDPQFQNQGDVVERMIGAARFKAYQTTRLMMRADKTFATVSSDPEDPAKVIRAIGTWKTKGQDYQLDFPDPKTFEYAQLRGLPFKGEKRSMTMRMVKGRLVDKATGATLVRHDWQTPLPGDPPQKVPLPAPQLAKIDRPGDEPQPPAMPARQPAVAAPMAEEQPGAAAGREGIETQGLLKIAATRDPALAISKDDGEGMQRFGRFLNPQINNDGTVAFWGAVMVPEGRVAKQGLWVGKPGALKVAMRDSDPVKEAGVGGKLWHWAPAMGGNKRRVNDPDPLLVETGEEAHRPKMDLRLNDAGGLAFNALVQASGSSRPSVFNTQAEGPKVVSFYSQEVTYEGQAVRFEKLHHLGFTSPQGDIAFFAEMAFSEKKQTVGLWSGKWNALRPILVAGQPAPGIPDAVVDRMSFAKLFSYGGGQLMVIGVVSGKKVDPLQQDCLWTGSLSTRLNLAFRSGSPISGLPPKEQLSPFAIESINSDGAIVLPNRYSTALYAGRPDQLKKVAARGDAAPGTKPVRPFKEFRTSVINAVNHVAFRGIVDIPQSPQNIGDLGKEGLWLASDGQVKLIAMTGDKVPGAPKNTIIAGIGTDINLNETGQVAFMVNVFREDTGIELQWPQAVLATDRTGRLQMVAMEGQTLELKVDDKRKIKTITPLYHTGGQDGKPRNLSNNGHLVIHMKFEDDTEAIMLKDLNKH